MPLAPKMGRPLWCYIALLLAIQPGTAGLVQLLTVTNPGNPAKLR
jgi:hypothetical protein